MRERSKTPPHRRRTALLVEPCARTRFVLRTALHGLGFKVVAARSRTEALDLIAQRTPDLIVMNGDRDQIYRVMGLPNARAEDVSARLEGLREAPPLGPAPAIADILSAVEELVPGTARASA